MRKEFNLGEFVNGNPASVEGNKVIFMYVAGPNPQGNVVIQWAASKRYEVRPVKHLEEYCWMAPLCEIEGKPVYVGDELWYSDASVSTRIRVTGYNDKVDDFSGLKGIIQESLRECYKVGNETWAGITNWSWEKPKKKKTGWVNVYPCLFQRNETSVIYKSKETALQQAASDIIDTVEITWME